MWRISVSSSWTSWTMKSKTPHFDFHLLFVYILCLIFFLCKEVLFLSLIFWLRFCVAIYQSSAEFLTHAVGRTASVVLAIHELLLYLWVRAILFYFFNFIVSCSDRHTPHYSSFHLTSAKSHALSDIFEAFSDKDEKFRSFSS